MPALLHISVGVELDRLAIHAHRRGFDYERPLQPHREQQSQNTSAYVSMSQHTSATNARPASAWRAASGPSRAPAPGNQDAATGVES